MPDCRWLLVMLSVLVAGCPQERPGAAKEISPQRIPPAVSLEPSPAATPDGGAVPAPPARRP